MCRGSPEGKALNGCMQIAVFPQNHVYFSIWIFCIYLYMHLNYKMKIQH